MLIHRQIKDRSSLLAQSVDLSILGSNFPAVTSCPRLKEGNVFYLCYVAMADTLGIRFCGRDSYP